MSELEARLEIGRVTEGLETKFMNTGKYNIRFVGTNLVSSQTVIFP